MVACEVHYTCMLTWQPAISSISTMMGNFLVGLVCSRSRRVMSQLASSSTRSTRRCPSETATMAAVWPARDSASIRAPLDVNRRTHWACPPLAACNCEKRNKISGYDKGLSGHVVSDSSRGLLWKGHPMTSPGVTRGQFEISQILNVILQY